MAAALELVAVLWVLLLAVPALFIFSVSARVNFEEHQQLQSLVAHQSYSSRINSGSESLALLQPNSKSPELVYPQAGSSWGSGGHSQLQRTTIATVEPVALYPAVITGSKPEDYNQGQDFFGGWLEGTQRDNRQSTSYAALSRTVPAQPYWNQRVRFRASVTWKGLRGGDEAALFVRVIGGGTGTTSTLLLDNMKGRRISGWRASQEWVSVVVDVPGPPETSEGMCASEDAVPVSIQFGFLLSAGRGRVTVQQGSLQVVSKVDVGVTSDGLPPWEPPGPDGL